MSNFTQIKSSRFAASSEYFSPRIKNEDLIYNIEKRSIRQINVDVKKMFSFREFKNYSGSNDSISDWIKENSDKLKDKPLLSQAESIKIAELFLDQPYSLEILLKLNLQGTKIIKQIISEYKKQKNIIDVLFTLLEFDLISISDGDIQISILGSKIVKRILKKI